MEKKNLFKRKNVVIFSTVMILLVVFIYYVNINSKDSSPVAEQYRLLTSTTAKKLFYAQSEGLTKPVDQRLVELDGLTIGCFGSDQVLSMNDNDKSLGGQCCGVLKSTHMYEEQLKALEEYDILEIPKDPYNIPVSLAKKLIQFDRDIKLTVEQQKIFDEASEMSNEKGPCCCKCWKWYAYSGLAKYLIVEYDYNAEQVVEIWDISDSCGEHGEHHSGILKHGLHNN